MSFDPLNNSARAAAKREEQIKHVREMCPLVTIEAEFSKERKSWTLKGSRLGEVIIRTRAGSLGGAISKFQAAYGLLVTAPNFRRLMGDA